MTACTAEIHHSLKRAFTQLGAESCWFATGRLKLHLVSPIRKCDYWLLNLIDHTMLSVNRSNHITTLG